MEANRSVPPNFDRTIWIALLVIAAMDVAATLAGTYHIAWSSFLKPLSGTAICVCGGWLYQSFRPDPRLSAALTGTAQLIAFAAVGAPLSYIAAGAGLPLWDSTFAAWDQSLGLDWMALLGTMNAHPAFHFVCALAYQSFPLQATMVILALAFAGRASRLRLFMLTFIATTVVTIALSAAMPAQGVWGHLDLSPQDYPAIAPVTQRLHLSVLNGLRAGSFRELVAQGAEGIITFPSLHAALAVLFIFALWPIRYLGWASAALNLTMIVATPIDGGHYFTDVIAGAGIAVVCWLGIGRMMRPVAVNGIGMAAWSEQSPPLAPDIVPVQSPVGGLPHIRHQGAEIEKVHP